MRLINVYAILDIEDGRIDREAEVLREFGDEELEQTRYAILSHCWGKDKEEVRFSELDQLVKMDKELRDEIRERPGYKKIVSTCRQARINEMSAEESSSRIEWVWVDTCCIDKSSSAELSEAINSMYRWYENAAVCYAFLQDVPDRTVPDINPPYRKSGIDLIRASPFGRSRWFTRGWTLQELIAPRAVRFFNRDWLFICKKTAWEVSIMLEFITRIPWDVLVMGISANRPSVAEIMLWAADRKTKRVEDRAYSLLGLFGVYMPMIYGEGKNALRRLQLEIIRTSDDQSIFSWDPDWSSGCLGSVLANDLSYFRHSGRMIRNVNPTEFICEILKLKFLRPCQKAHIFQSQSYTITNSGVIQIWLAIQCCRNSPWLLQAWLACHPPITITLALFNGRHYRVSNVGAFFREPRLHFFGEPRLHRLCLVYEETPSTSIRLILNDPPFHYNLVPRSYRQSRFYHYAFPAGFSSDGLVVSDNSHVVVVYVESELRLCFALVLGCCLGQHWAQIVCDDSPMGGTWPQPKVDEHRWEDYARIIHARTRWTGLSNVNRATYIPHATVVTHTHIPRSIWGVRLIISTLEPNTYKAWVDVIQCTGCCTSAPKSLLDSNSGFDSCTLRLFEDIR